MPEHSSTASTLEVVSTGLYMDGEFLEDQRPAPFATSFEVVSEHNHTEGPHDE
nr:hypothetical protein [Kocuria rhizophila]